MQASSRVADQLEAITHRPGDNRRPVVPFLLGTLVGGLAGTVLGSLVAGLLGDAIGSLFRSVSRRSGKGQQPPFDLLLQ
jgi:hypothetical protein